MNWPDDTCEPVRIGSPGFCYIPYFPALHPVRRRIALDLILIYFNRSSQRRTSSPASTFPWLLTAHIRFRQRNLFQKCSTFRGQILFDSDGDYGVWQAFDTNTIGLADNWYTLAATSSGTIGMTPSVNSAMVRSASATV